MRRLGLVLLAAAAAGCGAQSGLHVENGGRTVKVVAPPAAARSTTSNTPLPRRVTARIDLGGSPAIAWDGNTTLWAAVWAGGPHLLGSLVPVDAATGKPGQATALPESSTPYLLAADTTAVYVASGEDIMRIDPGTGDVTDTQSVGGHVRTLLESRGSLWAVVRGGDVLQLDPATLKIAATRHVTADPDAITTMPGGAVLVTDDENRTLSRMTVRNGRVAKPAGIGASGAGPPSQLTVYNGSIWVYEGTSVLRVAPTSRLKLLDRLSLPGSGGSIAAGAGGIWVSGSFGVARIDPATGDLDTPVDVGRAGAAIATTGSAVWVVLRSGTLVRVEP